MGFVKSAPRLRMSSLFFLIKDNGIPLGCSSYSYALSIFVVVFFPPRALYYGSTSTKIMTINSK